MARYLYLCSQSPRRGLLLEQLGIAYQRVVAPIEETALPNEPPRSFVVRMAIEKALSGFNKLAGRAIWVLGADTLVVKGKKVFGKPKSEYEASQMLMALSGCAHQVLSAVAIVHDGQVFSESSLTQVWFRTLSETEIVDYLATREPMGKAGAYAIQGLGAKFIERIEGSYSGVMGLPLFELDQCLRVSHYYAE
ncbi:MAG: septum formation inhibitor Maf [Shewanella vesiculosa]|nr:Maf family protein [Shewanella vesiculosa]NCN66548.1 septum formation inhibitor Maf [Thiomicrospira sp.]NCO15083.1 septum formation inhibitor Maf [Thiomicrospira sp.]NCP38873.1 septum formation inhibitor Maf [Shewanella vesiculosa]OIP96964.1 MAG: septum formation protein Maf [Thiomicrospira sp. CG2_30_44_34]